jgi:hypothetical protein
VTNSVIYIGLVFVLTAAARRERRASVEGSSARFAGSASAIVGQSADPARPTALAIAEAAPYRSQLKAIVVADMRRPCH